MWHVRGYTLFELMATLVIAGIAMSIAVPSLSGVIRRERVRSAMNRLAADLEFTRMAAVRNGIAVAFRFTKDRRCPGRGGPGYRIGIRGDTAAIRRSYAADPVLVCFATNGADTLVYNSRGLLAPFNNRTIVGVLGSVRDTITISSVGRIYRRY